MAIDPTAQIHPTAIVEDGATIGAGCVIGPYTVIGPEVVLDEDIHAHSHVVLGGITRIGKGTRIFPFASIGQAPQDLKYAGERTELIVGKQNTIREYVTMNPGTAGGGGVTRVGDDNLFMMSVHVGHDCQVGNGVVIANSVALAGHVTVEDQVVIGGLSGIQQFCRIGRGAMIGGMSGIVGDVIPFGTTTGERAHLAGLNLTGLRRRGADRDEVHELRSAYATLAEDRETLFQDRVAAVAERYPQNTLIGEIVRFVQADGAKRFTLPD